MGSGGSQEAEYTLKGPVPAGTYHVVCDAIVIRAVDMTFDLIWRHDGADVPLVSWQQHFEPLPGGVYDAQPYELDVMSPTAIDPSNGDQFVFRYTGANSTSSQAFIPNGDGATTGGRIPNFTLPK